MFYTYWFGYLKMFEFCIYFWVFIISFWTYFMELFQILIWCDGQGCWLLTERRWLVREFKSLQVKKKKKKSLLTWFYNWTIRKKIIKLMYWTIKNFFYFKNIWTVYFWVLALIFRTYSILLCKRLIWSGCQRSWLLTELCRLDRGFKSLKTKKKNFSSLIRDINKCK